MFSSEGYLSPVLIATDAPPTSPSVDLVSPGRDPLRARRPPSPREESLVVDERSGLRPACVVESKLTRLLKEASLPASRLQMRAMLKAR